MRRPVGAAAAAAMVLTLGSITAQEVQEKKKKPMPLEPEKVEQAHESLIHPAPDARKEASSLTEELGAHLPPGSRVSLEPVPRKNFIDDHIFGRIEADRIPHSPLSTDEEFLRRAYLDINGLPPTADEVRAFLADTDGAKRDKLVDRLAGSEDFLHNWTYFFNDLFRVNTKMGRGRTLWHYWTKEWLKADRPYDDVVREMITAGGKTNHSVVGTALLSRENVLWKFIPDHPDDYHLLNRLDAFDEFSILLYRAFLGMNTSCISCHDGGGHLEEVNLYLSGKERLDFFQQSAFMGKTRMVMSYSFESGLPMDTEFLIMDNTDNGYDTEDDSPWYTESVTRIPRFGVGVVEPEFLLNDEKPREKENWRRALGRMLTGHRQFARATANRIWAQLMSFGIVEPLDEWDLARLDPRNPPPAPWTLQPSNPELLEALADAFITSNYSIQHLVRTIAKSNAYQLSSTFDAPWKDAYTPYYARKFVRQLTAYQVVDAVQHATGVSGNYPVGTGTVPRLTMIASPEEIRGAKYAEVLDLGDAFFLANRDNPARRVTGSARQALLLMNSPFVKKRVQAKGGSRVEQLLKEYSPQENDRLVEELYLWTLSRRPSEQETSVARARLEKDRTHGAENLAWALVNNPEFLFNH
jgi:hypothetical protein